MIACFVCTLLGKSSFATCTKYIDLTIDTVEEKVKSVLVKTYLFGWIKIFKDKKVKEYNHHEQNGHKHVCNKCKNVKSIHTYPNQEPDIERESIVNTELLKEMKWYIQNDENWKWEDIERHYDKLKKN